MSKMKRSICGVLAVSRNSTKYCKVIILTSIVWFLLDVAILFHMSGSPSEPSELVASSNDPDLKPREPPHHAPPVMPDPEPGIRHREDEGKVQQPEEEDEDDDEEDVPADLPKQPAEEPAEPEVKQAPEEPIVQVPVQKEPETFRGMYGPLYERDANPPKEPGERGAGVNIAAEERAEEERLHKINQFNLLACNRISLNRSLEDPRPKQCKQREYPVDMPDASVIMVFHNEAWCTLLRTVHSVINRTPRRYLKEIILVDDASFDREFLGKELDDYVAKLPVPTHVVRMGNRSGLIRSRLAGADAARGKVLLFLDSHCEASRGWIEPLLHQVTLDRRNVPTPTIDNINYKTFSYGIVRGEPNVGGFTWGLVFNWFPMPNREKERIHGDYSLPVESPAMAGGLFAIDRDYFNEVGRYDDQMDVWGGENIEMSFRIWQCGGRIIQVPCSHVGHVFRKNSPHTWPGGVRNILSKNNRRLAEVWMDEYRFLWYFISPGVKHTEFGDVTNRKHLRASLKCQSFRWYLENVWPESSYNIDPLFFGQVRSPSSNMCMDSMGRKSGGKVGVTRCHGQGGNQVFAYTRLHDIRVDDKCLDATHKERHVKFFTCHAQGGNQYWIYDEHNTRTIVHRITGKCLDWSGADLLINPCNGAPSQQWEIKSSEELARLIRKYRVD